MRLTIAFGIFVRDASVMISYWPIFVLPVLSNSPRSLSET